MTTFRWGARSDTGRVRQGNEDSMLAVDGLFAVADGMGGHQAGEVASHVAIETLRSLFGAASTDALVHAVEKANRELVSQSEANPELRGMGTTICAMAIVDSSGRDVIGVVNVGDSRLYLLSEGALTRITDDHSLVATLVRQGRLTETEALTHPQRNILTRALGVDATVLVDSWELVPVIGDRYLLCTDGLFNEVDESRIASTMRRIADPDEAARELIRLANEGGGRDNITCVVVDVIDSNSAEVVSGDASRVRASHVMPEPTSAPPSAEGAPPPKPRASVGRRVTWRVGAFVGAVAVVLLLGLGFIWWTGTKTWYVGIDSGSVVIYRGKPGGVLWIDPQLDEVTSVRVDQVPQSSIAALTAGVEEPSKSAALAYIDRLVEQQAKASSATTSTSTTTTTR